MTYTDGDTSDLTALELRFLADGVFPDARIRWHSGPLDGGWSSGTVIEPYVSTLHGKLWVPVGYEGRASAAHSWLVSFDGEGVAPVDLRTERRVETAADEQPGTWTSLGEDG